MWPKLLLLRTTDVSDILTVTDNKRVWQSYVTDDRRSRRSYWYERPMCSSFLLLRATDVPHVLTGVNDRRAQHSYFYGRLTCLTFLLLRTTDVSDILMLRTTDVPDVLTDTDELRARRSYCYGRLTFLLIWTTNVPDVLTFTDDWCVGHSCYGRPMFPTFLLIRTTDVPNILPVMEERYYLLYSGLKNGESPCSHSIKWN